MLALALAWACLALDQPCGVASGSYFRDRLVRPLNPAHAACMDLEQQCPGHSALRRVHSGGMGARPLRDGPLLRLRLRGGADEEDGGDNEGHQRRKRKRKRTKKDIFLQTEPRPRVHIPVSARLKRLRGDVKEMKANDDYEPRFR